MIVAPGSSGTPAHRGGVFSRRSPLAVFSPLLPLFLAVAVGPLPLGAQAVLRGYVLDQTTEIPVVGAEVSLYLARGDRAVSRAVADSTGGFEFTGVRQDTYLLSSRRLGYLAVRTPQLNIADADTLTVVLWMSTEAIPLAPVEVVAGTFRPRPVNPQLFAFYERSRRHIGGHFILSEVIDRSVAVGVSTVIRQRVPGVRILGGEIYVAHGRDCAPDVYIDGVRQSDLIRAHETAREFIDQINPADIEGVEVYRGPSTLPAAFGGTTGHCGVIALWTRRDPG